MSLESAFLYLQAVGAGIAAIRLYFAGIQKRQPALLFYLLLVVICNVTLSLFPSGSHTYFWAYVGCQTLTLLTEALVVRELFSVIMGDYPGIQTAAKWILYGSLAVSAVTSLLVTATFWSAGEGARSRTNLFYILIMNRSVQFTLALVIISLLIFLSHYPLHLSRDKYVSSYFFSAVFLTEAAATLVDSISPHMFSRKVDLAATALLGLLFLTWAAMLRGPEEAPVRDVRFENPDEQELLLQLESINRSLSRAGRRQ